MSCPANISSGWLSVGTAGRVFYCALLRERIRCLHFMRCYHIIKMPRCVNSLKTITNLATVQLTVSAIENILVQERKDVNLRECARSCKRKRSYSCGDEERKDSPKKKIQLLGIKEDTSNKRKRDLDNEGENEEASDYHKKRPRLEKTNRIIYHSESDCHGEKRSKDDAYVMYSPSQVLFSLLKKYFHTLPSTLWNEYTRTLMDEAVKRYKFQDEKIKYFEAIMDYTFCGKLTRWSTSAMEYCLFSVEENHPFPSNIVHFTWRKLRCCRKLETLNMSIISREDNDIVAATTTLQRLQYLVSLTLVPPCRNSFHWAVATIGRHCRKLRELKIIYNGDQFTEGEGIIDLQSCSNMSSLWLFNFGRLCETKSVGQLLLTLTGLKVLFHKELPNAILEITKDKEGESQCSVERLGLERVDLCWYERGTGYQLVYVPSSYLLRVSQMCPNLRLVNLIGPPCLSDIVKRLPQLQVIILQQASLASCLGKTLQTVDVSALTVLRVSDVWDVTHDLMSAVAHKCPSLQVLSITSSSLEARGALISPFRRAPFPYLREVTLVPSALADRPSLTLPSVWQLGSALTRYILEGAFRLTSIHLHYKDGDIPHADIPSELDLEVILCHPQSALRSLTLEWPPVASRSLVERLVEACPALTTLAAITTWPLSPRQCADVIASYGHRIDIT